MKWDKEIQKFKQKEYEHELKLQQLPFESKSKGRGGPQDYFAQQEAEYKENMKWQREQQKWQMKQ